MKLSLVIALLACAGSLGAPLAGRSGDIDPNFLALKDCPEEPGCPALILLDETTVDNEFDRGRYAHHRIVNVFTQDGIERFGTIDLTATVGDPEWKRIRGRTILPNGKEIPLKNEHIRVKYLDKGRRRIKTKSLLFPSVVPGSIIESSYKMFLRQYSSFSEGVWEIQQELPVLHSRLIIKHGFTRAGWVPVRTDNLDIRHSKPKKNIDQFDAYNVPALPDEPFGPPPESLRARYLVGPSRTQSIWLSLLSGVAGEIAGRFIEAGGGVRDKARELTEGSAGPVEKVQRIYDFIQREIRTEEERLRQAEDRPMTDVTSAAEVLAQGYGNEFERTLLFLALVKEVDLDHGLVMIVSRHSGMLDVAVPDSANFDAFAAAVRTGAGWTYHDPATRHCPFGMISAEKEGGASNAILIRPKYHEGDDNDGSLDIFGNYSTVAIPFSSSAKNVRSRILRVIRDPEGLAEVDYSEAGTGLEDLRVRQTYSDSGEKERRDIWAQAMHDLQPGIVIHSASFEDLDSFEGSATIRSRLKLPGFFSAVGDRLLVQPLLLDALIPNPFTAASRLSPVHFPHRGQYLDRVEVEIPDGYGIEQLPDRIWVMDQPFELRITFEQEEGALIVERMLRIDAAIWPSEEYPKLRSFFEQVQQADRQVVVLVKSAG